MQSNVVEERKPTFVAIILKVQVSRTTDNSRVIRLTDKAPSVHIVIIEFRNKSLFIPRCLWLFNVRMEGNSINQMIAIKSQLTLNSFCQDSWYFNIKVYI